MRQTLISNSIIINSYIYSWILFFHEAGGDVSPFKITVLLKLRREEYCTTNGPLCKAEEKQLKDQLIRIVLTIVSCLNHYKEVDKVVDDA